ncbi:unnamed protein product [Brachionus calyciflorus]|uniref:Uncharacterized protein n=1 Tax=Brachionus calyciflorus TaxID=104777 RepID=A0A814IL44_9BILA|nr:unnamed protein product [Brachionus calyciflorus]
MNQAKSKILITGPILNKPKKVLPGTSKSTNSELQKVDYNSSIFSCEDSNSTSLPERQSQSELNSENSNIPISRSKLIAKERIETIEYSVFSRNDFCLIQWVVDKKFHILKLIDVCEPKIVKLNNEYSVRLGKNYFMAKVKFIGTLRQCESRMDSITSYSVMENDSTKCTKITNSTQNTARLNQDEPIEIEIYQQKIKELENALNLKNKEIDSLKIENLRKEEIINCYKKTYDDNKIAKILDLSINCVKLFASKEQLLDIPLYNNESQTDEFALSKKYGQITITKEKKLALDSLLNDIKESNTSVFRKLIGIFIPNDEIWALRDKETMKLEYSDQINASYEYISSKRDGFLYSQAENEIRKICNEARKRLRGKDFEIVKNDDPKNIENTVYILKGTKPINKSEQKKRKITDDDDDDDDGTVLDETSEIDKDLSE